MKKLIALCLALALVFTFAACGQKAPAEAQTDTTPLSVLESTWALYGEEEKFALMGGNPEAGIMDAPGAFDLTYVDALGSYLQLSEVQLAEVDEAATMIHMMNANTFTAGALHLTEGTDAAAFAQSARDNIQAAQWMCGIPEQLLIAAAGGQVVIAFGTADLMTVFEGHLTTAFADAQILVSEAIAG